MRHTIIALCQYGFDEDTITRLLGINHVAYRRYTTEQLPLSSGARLEIRKYKDDMPRDTVRSHMLRDLQRWYNVPYNEIVNARYNPKLSTYYQRSPAISDEDAVMLYLQENNPTRAQLQAWAPQLDTTAIFVKLGFSQHHKHLAQTLITEGVPYKKIAKQLTLSLGHVKKIASNMSHKRSTQGKHDPQEVLAYADEHGVHRATKKYEVSSAYVYYHRSKEH